MILSLGHFGQAIRARSQTVRALGAMMGSQVLIALIGIICNVVQARYVSPDVLGYFAAFAILGGYLTFLHMGSLTALAREYPYWIGKGDEAKAREGAAVAQGWVLLACGALAVLYAILVAISVVRGQWLAAAAWGANMIVTASVNYMLYLGCTYRTNSDFVRWSQVNLAGTLASAAALPAVIWWGFWGLCLRLGLPALFSVWLTHRYRPVRVRPRLDFGALWKLVKFGLPMDTAGYFSTSCMVATMSSIVLAKYGMSALGLLAFSRAAESIMHQLSVSFAQVFAPRIHQQMGATENTAHCVRYSIKSMIAGVIVMGAAISVAAGLAKPLITWLTPNYTQAVPMFRVLLLAGMYPVLMIPNQALIAAKKVGPTIVAHLACYAVFVVMAAVSAWTSQPVSWIVAAYIAGKLASVIVCYLALLWHVRQSVAQAVSCTVPA